MSNLHLPREESMTLDELHQMFDAMVDLLFDEHANGKPKP